jgi:hypothetical protein
MNARGPDQYRGAAFRQCHPDHTDFGATLRASLHHPFRLMLHLEVSLGRVPDLAAGSPAKS